MKRMKKVLAMLLAMVMVLGMSVTALAAPEDGGETAKIEVTGVEGETPVQLTYLQIIKPDQTTKTGWAFASSKIEAAYLEGYGNNDAQAVIQELIDARGADGYANSEAIGKALSKVAALGGFEEMENPQTVSSAGVYAVKAVQEGYTYNNMAAYVGFGEVAGTYPALMNAELVAKRTKIGLDKSDNDEDKVSAIGQIVEFTIKTNVPFMDPLAVNKTYFINDEITGAEYVLAEGAADRVEGTVTLGGNPVDGAVIQLDAVNKNVFHIDLSSLIDDQNSNAGLEVVVTYQAKVTAVTVDNKANAGHKDGDTYGSEYGEDEDDVYTGQITLTKTGEEDGELLAEAGFEVTLGDEVVYFTKDAEGVYTHVEAADVPEAAKTALDEAAEKKGVDRTELEQTVDGKTYVRQVFTKEDGTVMVQGLNVGTYTFTEKTAPKGYSVNENPATATLEVTAENGAEGENGTLAANKVITQTASMTDTKLSALPSTGGIGTTIFTIGGCAIMILAAGLFFATRRKKAK